MRNFIAATVYYIISILLLPVSLLGYVIWVGKGFLMGNPSGVSATAQGPLSARWAMHNLGTRPDEPANRLMPLLPGVPPVASRMVSFPTLLAHRVSGYVPPRPSGIPSRAMCPSSTRPQPAWPSSTRPWIATSLR